MDWAAGCLLLNTCQCVTSLLQQHVQKFAEWGLGLQAHQQMQRKSLEQQREQDQSTIQELRAQLRGAQQALSGASDSAQQARDKAQVHTTALCTLALCQIALRCISLMRTAYHQENSPYQQFDLTLRYHCSQNAVVGSQLPCPYIKNLLTSSVFSKRNDC